MAHQLAGERDTPCAVATSLVEVRSEAVPSALSSEL
jgi:hypothetical protein